MKIPIGSDGYTKESNLVAYLRSAGVPAREAKELVSNVKQILAISAQPRWITLPNALPNTTVDAQHQVMFLSKNDVNKILDWIKSNTSYDIG